MTQGRWARSFGDSLALYPVTPGSTWSLDRHRFVCGDVVELWRSGQLRSVIPQVDAVYTDPPWNAGNQRMFYTFAGRDVPAGGFVGFLTSLVAVLREFCPGGAVAMDMGLQNKDLLLSLLRDATTWGTGVTTYGHPPKPLFVWFGTFGTERRTVVVPDGLHGMAALRFGIDQVLLTDGSYFDPCCGKLVYVQEAVRRGMTAYGCELIPAKLAQGLVRLGRRNATPAHG